MTVPPTAVGTFRDKRGNFWINVEAVCDFLGADPSAEQRRIKALGRLFHPHKFMRHRTPLMGGRTRYYIFSIPAEELGRWLGAIADAPSYKCPRSGKRFTVDRHRLAFIRRTLKNQKALLRAHQIEEAISA